MHAVTGISLLALAGSVIAAPYGGGGKNVVYKTEMYTVVVTETGAPPPAHTQTVNAEANPQKGYGQGYGHGHRHSQRPQTSVVVTTAEQPKPSDKPSNPPSYAPEPPKSTQKPAQPTQPAYTQQPEKPSSTSAGYGPAPTGGSSNGDYMSIVNKWRAKLSLKDLQHDAKLESNIDETCTEGNGVMKHKLNPGTYGQVLAPAQCDISAFEHVFVGGWLCEMPNMKGMDGVCAQQSQGWTYTGEDGKAQTGHAEILTADRYSKIGCGCVKGIWGCDLA